jgi:hypothetical protein
MRTQAYTAVVCMAVLSLTVLPLAVPPKKKLYVVFVNRKIPQIINEK